MNTYKIIKYHLSRVQRTILDVWVGSPLCLHHLVDLASLLTVLSERLAAVPSLHSQLVSELDVV